MIDPASIPTDQIARIVYLAARAASTALIARGVEDRRFYPGDPSALSEWAGLTRGNLAMLRGLLLGAIRESDCRRSVTTRHGVVRYRAARRCCAAISDHCEVLPRGATTGRMPLMLLPWKK